VPLHDSLSTNGTRLFLQPMTRPWSQSGGAPTPVSGDARTSREYNILEADVVRNLDHMEELLTTVLGARSAYDSGDETFSVVR
jgi:hypothetical protein